MVVLLIGVVAALGISCGVLWALYLKSRRDYRAVSQQLAEAQRQTTQDQDALQQRRQLDNIKDEFISTVSHELRTPLTSIRGALGLLSAGVMGHMDEKAQNLLRIASSNTDRLVRLINDILDLERMDSGQASLHLRRCSLPEVVRTACDTMTAMAEAAGVRIDAPAASARPEGQAFEGDPDRMQQVLCNLLSNAIKFSPRNSTITVSSQMDAESLLLHIEDEGRGVPQEKIESIFDRFSQVDPADARQKGGTGLGLAICRSILSQHGGAIWAERNDALSSQHPGTTFTVRIPRVTSAESAASPLLELHGAILVVDDDPTVRQIVAAQLQQHGYTVIESDRGEHALQIVEKQRVDAILLDLYMPGMTGWETLERLKKNHSTADIPVVVLSVLSPSSKNAETPRLLASAQGWVQKPFNENLLLAELSRVLKAGAGPGHILLVEDDQLLAEVVMANLRLLKKQGVSVDHVRTLQEAKLACGENAPDIMILDLTLPDGDGFVLVEWLREQPALRKLPLVVYSGREVTGAEMDQLRLGPTQFLTKAQVQPKHVEELVLAMVRHLRHPINQAQHA